jgi:hypothetical protein
LSEEIVESGCPLGSRKFKAFQSGRIFPPVMIREFFNRIDPDLPFTSDRFQAG